MTQQTLIFATLLPEFAGERNELNNIRQMLQGYAEQSAHYAELHVVIGSAHPKVLSAAHAEVHALAIPNLRNAVFLHCPFAMRSSYYDQRGHEISFCKRFLHEYIKAQDWQGVLFWIDSDMSLDFKDIHRWVGKLSPAEKSFINFPYCLRGEVIAPIEQFGCYAINSGLLSQEAVQTQYRTALGDNGLIHRVDAPDCLLRFALLDEGFDEIRATDVASKHYNNEDKHIYHYDNGRCFSSRWV